MPLYIFFTWLKLVWFNHMHSVHPAPAPALPHPGPQLWEGVAGREGVTFPGGMEGGYNFYKKN